MKTNQSEKEKKRTKPPAVGLYLGHPMTFTEQVPPPSGPSSAPIQARFESIYKEIEGLGERLVKLGEMLRPVLRQQKPDSPNTAAVRSLPVGSSEVATGLDQILERLRLFSEAVDLLQDIIEL